MRQPRIIVACAVSLLVGCVSMSRSPPLSLGPPLTTPSDATLFERLMHVAQSRGYTVASMDPATGIFTVRAQTHVRLDPYAFTVQLYREGWVEVVPSGPRVRREGSDYVLPSELSHEYFDLVAAMEEALGGVSR
jgi:hypothetical protein